jgi:hypothetical protein
MSNSLAIVNVTATIRNLLLQEVSKDSELADLQVTTLPPDRARGSNDFNQLNVFMYQTAINSSWRNMPILTGALGLESGFPPLPLDLYYLITSYGQNNNEIYSHRLLGRAMSVMHDHPLLMPAELKNAQVGSDLYAQKERVRITPQPLSVEEMSKLWTAFQTQYRVSAAYMVSAVLIESTKAAPSPLPVLRRGEEDKGMAVFSESMPYITSVLPPEYQPGVRLGEILLIRGERLNAGMKIKVSSNFIDEPLILDSLPGGTSNEIQVQLRNEQDDPDALSKWAPGFYTLAVIKSMDESRPLTSNELAFALSPSIALASDKVNIGELLKVVCKPRLRPNQSVFLIIGDNQISPETLDTPEEKNEPTSLEFRVPDIKKKIYTVRLSVDGVHSIPVPEGSAPPWIEFDPKQKVTVS